MIQIRGLNKRFQDGAVSKPILVDLNLTIPSGVSTSIMGESGSGKSTLLHLLAALDKVDSGTISVNDADIGQFTGSQTNSYRKQEIGIVFQKFNLIDCLTVWDNVCFPAKINDKYDATYINELMAHLGIQDHKNKLPNTLSGGEQQRVAIARALSHKPSLVLADEPTGNLDDKTSDLVSKMLFNLCRNLQTTLIVVTHSSTIANLAELSFDLKDGRLVAK